MDDRRLDEMETLIGALIAQLIDMRVLRDADIEAIAKRMDWADMSDMAESVRSIKLLDTMSKPENLRASFDVIDGGNADG